MSIKERLAATRWLASTPASFRDAVLASVRVRRVPQGAWVYGVEDEVGGPVAVLSGALAFDLPVGARNAYVEWLVQPGHWVGAAALIMGNTRQANLRALLDTEVAELSAHAVRRIAEQDPEGWRSLGRLVVMNSHITISVAAGLMLRRTEARVAAILLQLSQSGFVGQTARAAIPLPQAEVARLCALSRPILSRQLTQFDAQGLTRTGYRSIEVLNAAGLSAKIE